MTDLALLPAHELARLIRVRELSPTELMRHTLDRVERLNPALGAVVSPDPERALAEAAAQTRRVAAGADLGPLGGLPLAVKDLEDAAGFPTSRGTRAFHGRPPASADSVHTARLRAAGAIVIGKTNTPPLGAAVHTTNGAFGTTRNPWAPDRSPGGSSGGSAAAVAAGLVPLATAGDGGGSTRIPAALCGLFGLKTSRGRIPHGPQGAIDWTHHSCPTPMTRTVHDAALHLDLTAGYHRADPWSLEPPGISYVAELARSLPALRIVMDASLGVAEPTADVRDALVRVAGVLRDLGHHVVEDAATTTLPHADTFDRHIRTRQRVLAHQRLVSVLDDFERRPEDFEPGFASLLADAGSLGPRDTREYWLYRGRLHVWADDVFDGHDLLLTPTTPVTAWPAEGPDIARAVRERTIPIAYTAVFNDTGHPAISVPAGLDAHGLPIGVQLVAPRGRDDLALRVAAAYEQAADGLIPDLAGAVVNR
ncbi:hypothetical protein B4N89_34960 [Embleya scabrispora]|uniref:Amidase domain-containing protein n=1 Tax=Embleya scabrispora TaxID=159449 RepID=A0A1T3NRB9_9ACTN|nr:amidase [Embleya scabrispora]OPC79260.1 hypothetical protein B4N89_34960 [Embleya scabrispora]